MATMQGQTLPNGFVVIEVTIRADGWTVLGSDQHGQYGVWTMRPNAIDTAFDQFLTISLGKAVVEYHRRSGRLEVIEMALSEIQAKERHPSHVITARIGEPEPAGKVMKFSERKKNR